MEAGPWSSPGVGTANPWKQAQFSRKLFVITHGRRYASATTRYENWRDQGFRGCISKAVHKGVKIFCLRSTQARMPVLRGRCVGFVLTGFALDVGLDIAF